MVPRVCSLPTVLARLAISFALVVALVASLVSVVSRPVDAQEDALTLAEVLPDPDFIHPDIAAQVPVDLRAVGPVADRLAAARLELNDATSRSVRSAATIGSLEVERGLLVDDLLDWRAEEATSDALLAAAELDLSQYAVDTFMEFEEVDLGALRLEGSVDPADTLSDEVGGLLTTKRDVEAERHERAVLAVADLEEDIDVIDERVVELGIALEEAEGDAKQAQSLVDQYQPEFERALLGAPIVGVEFPLVVLDAYFQAQLIVAEERPGCEVRWDHLAGIGRVESYHGTYGGNTVGTDGRTSGEILGPVLDGDPWLAIPDSDGGFYDGNTEWDRAVGPMQFIPTSWEIYGRDGNGDDEEDPHNLYDAALAAAQHLCGTTGGLSSPGNFQRALLGYNRSAAYGLQVMSFAEQYREAFTLVPSPDPS